MTALLKASTSTDQANAYGHFREAYRAAALKLSSLDPPVAARPSNAAIRTALADTSRGFDALASAAGRQDHAAYRAARREVGQSETTVRQALARLNSLGYHLGTGP
ncbi:MAG TPA: hypothetical protein VJU79_05765 [Candidatus Dormibacteraeota bacterium]|nr:hypothetical protein [Candidatus Dormibacteraeota bacterium]